MATVKLSEILGQFLDEQNYGQAEYAKAYRIAIRCLRTELELDIIGKKCETTLVIGEDKTAPLPDNFIKEIFIDIEDDLSSELDDCSNLSDFAIESFIHKTKPEYEIDLRRGKVIFPTNFQYSEVTMLYTGRECFGDNYEVDDRLTNCMIAYLVWNFNKGKRSTSVGQENYYKMEFYREKDNAKFRIGRPSNYDLQKDARKHTFYGIKR